MRVTLIACDAAAASLQQRLSAQLRLIEPPTISWMQPIAHLRPKYKIKLATTPTTIEKWSFPGLPSNISLHIKRDDQTGGLLGGNKVRKLEYLLADALVSGADTLITCGAVNSNHCRATCIAGRLLGFDSHLLLRSQSQDPDDHALEGNLLLNTLTGAKCHLVPRVPYLTGLLPRMNHLQKQLEEEQGKKVYHIPVGGSNVVGFWGYVEAFDEMMTSQSLAENYDDVVLATGSGGTAAALAVSNVLCGSPIKIHAIAVCDDSNYFYKHVDETLLELGLDQKYKARDLLSVVEGHKGRGYGLSTQTELDEISSVSMQTGVVLDPVYTGKGYLGLKSLILDNPRNLKGNRVLFLHTGGAFGVFDGAFDKTHALKHLVQPFDFSG
eukprot:m.165626 g.165626  ORF g.165626 m.165626 type:complete len:382 (+) comp31390_c1_seq4:124-1269(+)